MGERTVIEKLDVKGKTINQLARWYFNGELYVNRKYQRKLVWSIDEKVLFIDSLINRFPTPSIMINAYQEKTYGDEWVPRYDIIDGLQRLDAIFSFIRGDFGIKYQGKEYQYFNISHIPSAKVLLQDPCWKQHENTLSDDVCADFADMELPVILSGQDYDKIEEIFRRINSTGRKISMQDLRQSGAVGEFPDLVRRIASRVRGDYTFDDKIWLADMPKISVGLKKYRYGVDLDTVFWRRHDLINPINMRESKDEEIIESLIAAELLKKQFRKKKNTLDSLYDTETALGQEIERLVREIGKDNLENQFAQIFDLIDMIFQEVHSDFSSYIFEEKRVSNKDECFKMLFLALYRLISEGYVPVSYTAVANVIRKSKTLFVKFTKVGKTNYDELDIETDNLYELLKPSFSKELPIDGSEMTAEIDRRLSYSKLERQMTEFKIGISDFDSNEINISCIQNIAKTLVGMANTTHSQEEGLVIIGIADNKEAYDRWYDVYGKAAVIKNQHYIPGVSDEAQKLFADKSAFDKYYRKIRKLISAEPISQKLKEYVLETFEPFDYHGKEIIIFRSKYMGEISLYDNEKYVRHSSETVRV